MDSAIITWYSGYTGREYPLIFRYRNREYRTERLIAEKLIEEEGTSRRFRTFLVRTAEGCLFEIADGEEVEIKPQYPT